MREADEEIREIKKEIIESRGLIIKTSNLTNSLAADVKSIAKRQVGYERRFYWNSAVAYGLFATLSFAGLKLASDARIREIESEHSDLRQKVRELEKDLTDETERTARRARAELKAAHFYDLIRQQKRAEVVNQYAAIQSEELSQAESAFFRDVVDRFRLDLSVSAYQSGLDLVRTGRYVEATERLEEAIHLKDEATHIPAAKYELAKSLRKLGRQSEALVIAQQVVDQSLDRDIQANAMWLVSECAEELGDLDRAREGMRTFLRRWPRSTLVPDVRRRLRELVLRSMREHSSESETSSARKS